MFLTKNDFLQRFPIAVVIIIAFAVFLILPIEWYLLSLIVIGMILSYEYALMLKNQNIILRSWLLYLNTAVIFLITLLTDDVSSLSVYFLGIIAFYAFAWLYSFIRNRKKDQRKIFFYIAHQIWIILPLVCFSYFSLLEKRIEYFLFLASIIAISDSFAFFGGKAFGKHKLTRFSPNKTIEGSLCGFIFASIVGALLNQYFALFSFVPFLFLLIIINFTAQIGDILQSALKRYCKVKDSGKILMGHGGMFDRLDSYLISGICYYFFLFYCIEPIQIYASFPDFILSYF